MTSKWLRTLFLAAALLIAVGGLADDAKQRPKDDGTKTKAELIKELEALRGENKGLREQNKQLGDALEQVAARLGGKARVGVEPKMLRTAEAESMESLIKGIQKIIDTVREVESLRVQIKQMAIVAERRAGLEERVNEIIATNLMKIEAMKKLTEAQAKKIEELEAKLAEQ